MNDLLVRRFSPFAFHGSPQPIVDNSVGNVGLRSGQRHVLHSGADPVVGRGGHVGPTSGQPGREFMRFRLGSPQSTRPTTTTGFVDPESEGEGMQR
jgi:hypothetical protein